MLQYTYMHTKKFTILHSNDIHGDFMAEVRAGGGPLLGGLALLSGYIARVRQEEENVIYAVAGDMVQGSLIDSEFKGISTIEIMNYLSPDVVALGNHEFDYGLPHLLFLEKMANFPIVNANLYIRNYNRRLMRPYLILKKSGFEILFTGIITEKVMDALKTDSLVGSFVSLEEASREVGKICNAYRNSDIDLTVLLTHIGYDSDVQLAKMIDPALGVDMIIGGHSHTALSEATKVNDILIAQAGTGADQIGRFDITVDDDTNSILEYKWKSITIDGSVAEPDRNLEEFIASFKTDVDRKYNSVITKFTRTLTHPKREVETEVGNLFADAIAAADNIDAVLVGSGSIRQKQLGPVVTLQDLMTIFPYDDTVSMYEITGAELKSIFTHIMRNENMDGEGECYQVNRGVKAVHDNRSNSLLSLEVSGKPVRDSEHYTIALQGFHFNNSASYLNITGDRLVSSGKTKVVTTSARDILEEYFRTHQNLNSVIEGRMVYRSG